MIDKPTLVLNANHDVGVAIFLEGSWQQGYYWREGMAKAKFFDKPKSLANDIIWFTNVPFEYSKSMGNYFKSDRFFRVPMSQMVKEIMPDTLHPQEIAMRLGKMLSRMGNMIENKYLREPNTLVGVMSECFSSNIKATHRDWDIIGETALSWHWSGSHKHRTLLGGSLYAPRHEFITQLLSVPVPDLSQPPQIVTQALTKDKLRPILTAYAGFVSARIENVSAAVQDFVSLDRTLWSTQELLWLIDHADVTTKTLYLANPISHPHKSNEIMSNFKMFSWCDGFRMEALYLSPGKSNKAMEAYLRSIGHIAMAYFAEYLSRKKGVSPISLSFGKIGIAYSAKERAKVAKASRECGLLPILAKSPEISGDWSDSGFF